MSRKLALSLLLLMLGLASWDAVLDHEEYPQGATVSGDADGEVRAKEDGTGKPPGP